MRVPDYIPMQGEINKTILAIFRERGIVIPFPQHEVRLIGAAVPQEAAKEARHG